MRSRILYTNLGQVIDAGLLKDYHCDRQMDQSVPQMQMQVTRARPNSTSMSYSSSILHKTSWSQPPFGSATRSPVWQPIKVSPRVPRHFLTMHLAYVVIISSSTFLIFMFSVVPTTPPTSITIACNHHLCLKHASCWICFCICICRTSPDGHH